MPPAPLPVSLPLVLCAALLSGCTTDPYGDWGVPIPAEEQRPGDADAGWEVLVGGDYMGSGVPLDVWNEFAGSYPEDVLGRGGDAGSLPPSFNLFNHAESGVPVVSSNCLGCHGSWLEGSYVVGLGDPAPDYTRDNEQDFTLLGSLVSVRYGADSDEYRAVEPWVRGFTTIAPSAVTPFVGVSPAFAIEEAAAAYRLPGSLEWLEQPGFQPAEGDLVYASDTPPWWHFSERSSLYYNGMGRGDFARLLMQIAVVTTPDNADAARIDGLMGDLAAWLRTVEAPVWSGPTDPAAEAEGEAVFEQNCALCHGMPGAYPNLWVSVERVGTDPAYAEHWGRGLRLAAWFNTGWFGSGAARLQPRDEESNGLGYVAPPLSGVWASAPYLHNGSIPTLRALLDSSQRPRYWRGVDTDLRDPDAVGLYYEELDSAVDGTVYDTTRVGYGNGGHDFGDALSDTEREALLAWLRTL